MCTALSYTTDAHYFGRTLDVERDYGQQIIITPRGFQFSFGSGISPCRHFAMIGMAVQSSGVPLYFDAVNEKGLAMAGLSFPEYAYYHPSAQGRDNIASFEFIPWILTQCESVSQARSLLSRINICDSDFSESMPSQPLHWIISDQNESVTVESVREGLRIYKNPVGVLTNSPAFDMQLFNLNNYMALTRYPAQNRFSEKLLLHTYSRGMGALGLPGDLSSMSRFVRAAFTRENSIAGTGESGSVSQFFHILGSVRQQRGCTVLSDGSCEITAYTSCCNTSRGIYYYTTYENSSISCVDMHREQLDSHRLICYTLISEQQITLQN